MQAPAKGSATVELNAHKRAEIARRPAGRKMPPPVEVKVQTQEAARVLEGHREWVLGLAMSKDERLLLSGDDAGQVVVWDRAEGKEGVTVGELLSHQAGLIAVDTKLTFDEIMAVEPIVAALAAQRPLWPLGEGHGYHAITFGWLAGELVRRVDGRTIGRYFADEIAAPLGLDFWIGLPESEEPRVSKLALQPPPETPETCAAAPIAPSTTVVRLASSVTRTRAPVSDTSTRRGGCMSLRMRSRAMPCRSSGKLAMRGANAASTVRTARAASPSCTQVPASVAGAVLD